jgi:hypothetical protein
MLNCEEPKKQQQARIMQQEIKISPPPRSRSQRNSQGLKTAQIEQVRLALLNAFRW